MLTALHHYKLTNTTGRNSMRELTKNPVILIDMVKPTGKIVSPVSGIGRQNTAW